MRFVCPGFQFNFQSLYILDKNIPLQVSWDTTAQKQR